MGSVSQGGIKFRDLHAGFGLKLRISHTEQRRSHILKSHLCSCRSSNIPLYLVLPLKETQGNTLGCQLPSFLSAFHHRVPCLPVPNFYFMDRNPSPICSIGSHTVLFAHGMPFPFSYFPFFLYSFPPSGIGLLQPKRPMGSR